MKSFFFVDRASGKLRDLYIQQRKCLFYDESNEQQPVYSVNICNSVCKAQHAINMCGCRPYFYPFMSEIFGIKKVLLLNV